MHFHWDNFDSAVSRAFRSVAPPLFNLIMITYIFYEALGRLIGGLISSLPAMSEKAGKTAGDIPNLLSNIFPKLAEKFLADLSIKDATAGASGLSAFVQAVLGSAFTAIIGLILGIIVVAYVLDFVIRAIGIVTPFRADLDERRLVRHQSLDGIFREAGLEVGSSRYYKWLSARMQAESLGKESSYFEVRSRLLAAVSMNERAFSYVGPYLALSIASIWMRVDNSCFLLVIVVLAGVVLLARQFSLGCEIVVNDLETYIAMPLADDVRAAIKDKLPADEHKEPVAPFLWAKTLVLCPPWLRWFWKVLRGSRVGKTGGGGSQAR